MELIYFPFPIFSRPLTIQIVGCDSSEARVPHLQHDVLVAHMKKLRTLPGLSNAIFVIIPESNLAFEAIYTEEAVHRAVGSTMGHSLVFMTEDDNRTGVKTNNFMKMAMARALAFEFEHGQVRFHAHMISGAASPDNEGVESDRMRTMFVNQLKHYMRIVKPSSDPLREPTVVYSGKMFGADDLAIAIQILNIMRKRFHTSEYYSNYNGMKSVVNPHT